MASIPNYNVHVPYVGVIENGFHPGKILKVQGTVLPSANRFAINLVCGPNSASGDDIALHFNPRFDKNCIVRNALQHMNWQHEEAHGHMPLLRGQGFEILILCDPNHYKIAINGQHFAEFAHRIPYQRVSHLSIEGDVTIGSIFYEGGQQVGMNPAGGMGHPSPGFAPPHSNIPGGAPVPYANSGKLYPTVPPAMGTSGSMPYPTQPGGYGQAPMAGQPMPGQPMHGQPMYGQGYQQPPYPGHGQVPGYAHSPGQYPSTPQGYQQGYPQGYPQGNQGYPQGNQGYPQGHQGYPQGQPQGYQQYPSTPSQESGGFLDKAGAAIAGAIGTAGLMNALGSLAPSGYSSNQHQGQSSMPSNRGGVGGFIDQAGAALSGALGTTGLMGAMGGAHPPNPPPMPPTSYAPTSGAGGFSGLASLGLQNMMPKSLDDLKNLVQTRRY